MNHLFVQEIRAVYTYYTPMRQHDFSGCHSITQRVCYDPYIYKIMATKYMNSDVDNSDM